MKILYASLFSLLTLYLYSQTATVTADKMNVFYKGVDNPMTVVVENYACKDIVVKTDVGEIKGDGCHYYYHTKDSTASNAKVYVGVLTNSVINWIDTINVRLKLVPDPTTRIGGVYGGLLPKGTLCAAGGIIAGTDDWDYDVYFAIKYYSIKIFRNDSVLLKSVNIQGPRFQDDLIKFIHENCKANDDLLFYNIIATGPDGLKRKLKEVRIKLE